MEVILGEDIRRLGKIGDVVQVKDGYARNYLIPQKKAYLATSANLKKIEKEKEKKDALIKQKEQEAKELAEKLKGISITVPVEVNDLEKLYGSVTELDIAKVLEAEGYTIDKDWIKLQKPIEELGIYEVDVTLHPEVTTQVRIWVTKK